MKFSMSNFVRLVRGRGDVPKEISDSSPQGMAEKVNQLVGYLRQQRDIGPLFAAPIGELGSQVDDLVKRVKRLEQEPKLLLPPSGVVGVGQELLRPSAISPQYARLATDADPTDLRMSDGTTWNASTHGVQWPWYCKASKCDATGDNIESTWDEELEENIPNEVYLRFPRALSEDILVHGGPGVWRHNPNVEKLVFAYAPFEGQPTDVVAGDSTVMHGDILWHSLRFTHHLPILASTVAVQARRMLWVPPAPWTDRTPNQVYEYTTGWEVDSVFQDRYIYGGLPPGQVAGEIGGSSLSGMPTVTDYFAGPNAIAAGPNHVHDGILPPFVRVFVLKWVGF